MSTILAVLFFAALLYLFILFARQEHIQDYYENTVDEVEGRLEWAKTRSCFPFGMKAQIDVASKLLRKAKNLWEHHKWQQAYSIALQSQKAMNRAQSIYKSAIRTRIR